MKKGHPFRVLVPRPVYGQTISRGDVIRMNGVSEKVHSIISVSIKMDMTTEIIGFLAKREEI